MDYDRELIAESIAKQYHILPSEQGDLSYKDWSLLVSGLMDDTPLGRVVSIRAEKDPSMLKNMPADAKRIRSQWLAFRMNKQENQLKTEQKANMETLDKMLASLFGGKR